MLFEVTDGASRGTCLDRFDEKTHQISAVSSAWNIYQISSDEKFYYFATSSLSRSAR